MAEHKGAGSNRFAPRQVSARKNGSIKRSSSFVPEETPGSFEEFSRQRFVQLPQKSNLTEDDVRDEFVQILSEMQLKISSLKVEIKRAHTLAQVTFSAALDVTLEYDDYFFRTLDRDEIRAVLSHEACHLATLPDSSLLVYRGATGVLAFLQSTIIEAYDEFLAHDEFLRRFSGTKIFLNYQVVKNREFSNYELIVGLVTKGFMDPAMGVFSIVNDAVYFPSVRDDSFTKWCGKRGLNGLAQFLDWLVEDFAYIRARGLDRRATMEGLQLEGFLSLGVNVLALLTLPRIRFVDTASESEEKAKAEDPALAEVWRNRRTGNSNTVRAFPW